MRFSIPHSLRLPTICLICEMTYVYPTPLCPACIHNLPYLKNYCQSCGASVLPPYLYCSSCIHDGSLIYEFNAPLCYQEPIKYLIQVYKSHQGLDLAAFFADLIIQNLTPSSLNTQCLIPVPLHRKRLLERGFHQTGLLAKQLSRKLKIATSLSYCQKIKNTRSQATLDKKARVYNLQESFLYQKPPYTHITLIDDVHTTGTTLNQIAQGFLDLGVKKIDAWVIAKT